MNHPRFWNKKTMLSLGFQVLGLDFGSNNSYYPYVTYFPEKNAILFFNSHENRMSLFFMKKEDYDAFQNGDFAITQDPSMDRRKGVTGVNLKYFDSVNVNKLINRWSIENIKQMKEAIAAANKLIHPEI